MEERAAQEGRPKAAEPATKKQDSQSDSSCQGVVDRMK